MMCQQFVMVVTSTNQTRDPCVCVNSKVGASNGLLVLLVSLWMCGYLFLYTNTSVSLVWLVYTGNQQLFTPYHPFRLLVAIMHDIISEPLILILFL